ncbi:hypothetical protein [Shewanella algidipiscicola]|uniref:Uncharacterized protein n=1 Tax=Shewanella algidipiscicola TaxID=614070 RepID=A0ABQ4NTE4_9GAMM|nr:hypothetical protein [Shewanella algidipiscicola]GIU02824.1 hypothetical protein TUM4630_35260 [Shewanella algidipiscicola]
MMQDNSELELMALQNAQLQEELEFQHNKMLKTESLESQILELEAESELSLLQIAQLQEELEYYYCKYSQLKSERVKINSPQSVAASLVRQARLSDRDYSTSSHQNYIEKLIADQKILVAENSKQASYITQLEETKVSLETHNSQLVKGKAELEASHAQLVTRHSELEASHTRVVTSNSELEASHTKLVTRNAEPEASYRHLVPRHTELEASHSQLVSRHTELEASHTKLVTSNSDLEASYRQLVTRHAELEASHTQLTASFNKAESELADMVKQRDEVRNRYSEHKHLSESLNCQLETQKNELLNMSQSNHLGQKMLAKSQLDLDHLRNSYADKVQSEQELIELVKELKQKLTLASRYYVKLQQDHPELLSSVELSEEN